MGDSKSSPSDNNSAPSGKGLKKIVDCYKDAYANQTNATSGHIKFMDRLEDAFPGLDLSQARQIASTADKEVAK